MEVVTALRTLWRFRLLVVLVAVVAVLAGLSIGYRFSPPTSLSSKQYQVAIGSATVLVDTPSSQVVDLGGGDTATADIATLSARASLLASVMTSSPIKDEVAAKVGLTSDQLLTISPATTEPVPGAAPIQPGPAALANPNVYVLKATIPTLESGVVPIISIQTQSPDPEKARRLADTAVKVLQKHLTDVALTDNVPDARRLNVRQLGPARATVETRGPSKMLSIVAALGLFALGCGLILGTSALVTGWRQASALEGVVLEPAFDERAILLEDPPFPQTNGYHAAPSPPPARPEPVQEAVADEPAEEPEAPPAPDGPAKRSWASL
jgi:capsular polysaccharide biosynthesis protein